MKRFRPARFALVSLALLGLSLAAPLAVHAAVHVNWSLLAGDSYCPHRAGCHEQLHKVHLPVGHTYVIFMKSSQFDTYLFLEDMNGTVLAQDDDSGGNLNARIIFTPSYTGHYNIVATSYKQGATGSYTISVTP